MSEIKCVRIQTGENRVAEGFYTLEGDLLTMVYADGEPVRLSEDLPPYHARLKPNDNPSAIAAVLARQIRTQLSGEKVPGFNNSISYGSAGWR